MMMFLQIVIGCMVLLGVGVIVVSKNIIHAAYALALCLLGIAGMYVFLDAAFMAVVQILLYAGGVVILLVFGVMMTNRLRGEKVVSGTRNQVFGAVVSFGVFGVLVHLISQGNFQYQSSISQVDQVKQIGLLFLTEHLVAFELIAFVLLVALVGAAYLAKQSSNE